MCTCESLVKKLWGIANLFPIAFPSKEGPRKGKVAKRNPQGGFLFECFSIFGQWETNRQISNGALLIPLGCGHMIKIGFSS